MSMYNPHPSPIFKSLNAFFMQWSLGSNRERYYKEHAAIRLQTGACLDAKARTVHRQTQAGRLSCPAIGIIERIVESKIWYQIRIILLHFSFSLPLHQEASFHCCYLVCRNGHNHLVGKKPSTYNCISSCVIVWDLSEMSFLVTAEET